MYKPDEAAEDDDEDDEDEERARRHADDDRELLLGQHGVGPGVGEGEGDVALGHAAVVDGHAAVLAEVAGGHRRHRQAEVPLDATFGSRVCQNMSQFLLSEAIVMVNTCFVPSIYYSEDKTFFTLIKEGDKNCLT